MQDSGGLMRLRQFAGVIAACGSVLACAHAWAEEPVPAAAGRYQLAIRHDPVAETLFMIDTASGNVWQLRAVPARAPDGSPGMVERWFPIEVSEASMPAVPFPPPPPSRLP